MQVIVMEKEVVVKDRGQLTSKRERGRGRERLKEEERGGNEGKGLDERKWKAKREVLKLFIAHHRCSL